MIEMVIIIKGNPASLIKIAIYEKIAMHNNPPINSNLGISIKIPVKSCPEHAK